MTGFTHESQKSKSIEWYTPEWIFTKLNVKFDVDVCTKKGGINYIPANKYFCKEDDGLLQEWVGSVWCNPPYGKETSIWLEKFCQHKNGIALVFARTDTKWFHNTVEKADAVLFLKGRVQFVDGDNKTNKTGSTSGSMLIAFGKNNVEALKNLEGFFVLKGDKHE